MPQPDFVSKVSDHVAKTWGDVLSGKSSTAEKAEFAVEAAAVAVGTVVAFRSGSFAIWQFSRNNSETTASVGV